MFSSSLRAPAFGRPIRRRSRSRCHPTNQLRWVHALAHRTNGWWCVPILRITTKQKQRKLLLCVTAMKDMLSSTGNVKSIVMACPSWMHCNLPIPCKTNWGPRQCCGRLPVEPERQSDDNHLWKSNLELTSKKDVCDRYEAATNMNCPAVITS